VPNDLTTLTRAQRGLISHRQALTCGLSDHGIRHRIANGTWERIHRGLYLVSGNTIDRHHEILGAILRVGGPAWASHSTAAELWELPIRPPTSVEITTPLGRLVRQQGIRAHRSGRISENDVRVVDGIPVLSGARTVLDLSGRVGVRELGRIMDDGLRRRVFTLAALHAVFRELPYEAPGRSPATMRKVLAARTVGFHPGDSELERTVLQAILDAGLPEPISQHPVKLGRNTYRLDLAYPDHKIAIEVDGFAFHHDRGTFDRDRQRQNDLVTAGWTVLRFTARSTPEEIAATVRSAFVRLSAP